MTRAVISALGMHRVEAERFPLEFRKQTTVHVMSVEREGTYAGSARAGVGVPTFVILYVVNDTSRLHHSSVLKRHSLGWVVNLSISIRRQSHDCSVVCKTLIAYDRVSHKKISARYSSISDSNLFLLSQTLNDVQYLSRPSRTLSAPPPPSLSFHNW